MKRALSVLVIVMLALLGFTVPAAAGGDSDPTIDSRTLDPVSRASAAASPCGSSYRHIGHYAIGSPTVLAYMDVYWSSTTKRNCLITNHTGRTYGVLHYTQATIRRYGASSWPPCPHSVGCDGEMYRYYAGPVYTPVGEDMSHQCIDIKGYLNEVNRTLTRIHCG